MDDTVAMQDTNGPTLQAPVSKADVSENSFMTSTEQLAGAADTSGSRPDSNPCAPQSPSTALQQVHFDASSVASDGSQDQAGSSTSSKQHGPPRRTYSSVDVDAAKQAAMSALAGLDMTTTKANLDASKQAAATARANGEVPAHVRKSNLRSVSCRQLGSSSTTGGVGKSVAFDEASKQRPADGAARTVQWRAGTTGAAADGTQPRRTTRAPASRCISLPHVLQGRAGMANRLAATYAQEAALQQQLQLLNGSTQAGHQFAGGVNQLQAGVPNMDVLSMYQLQQQAAAGGLQHGQLISQRSFGANQVATMDDSVLQLRSQNALLAAQQQQQQQAARLAGNWPNAAAQQQRVSWAPGTAQVPQQQAALANQQQLLLQLQGGTQAMPAAGGAGNEALWLQNPAAASAALMGTNRPQNLLLANQAGGIPGLAASSALLSPHLQQGAGTAGLAANPQTSAMVAAFTQLLEQYQNVSWTVLAAAQADSNVREQLLTEVVLQLTLLHTLSGVLKSTLAPGVALSDFSYLGSAARRHIATFSRLSQAGDLAVQLLAMVAPLACRHLTSTDVMEAAFLVLDTLALANRDVAAVVAQQRINALGNLLVQLPMDQLLQQQTLGLAWINSMAAAVNRNKQVLESIAGGDQAGVGQPAVSAAILQGGNGLPLAGMPLSSQPLMVSPTGPTLSPTGKTPLATYFEEQNPATGMVSPSGAAGAGGAPGLGGVPGLTAAVPADVLLQDGLAGFTLNGQAGATADDAAAGLASLQLGVAPGLAPTGAGAGAAAGATGRTYSPLGGGLPLFGDASLLVPSSAAGQNGPSSGGVAAGIVGV